MDSASRGQASEYYSGFNSSPASRPRAESTGDTENASSSRRPKTSKASKSSKSTKSSKPSKSSKASRTSKPSESHPHSQRKHDDSRPGGGLASSYYDGFFTSPASNIPDEVSAVSTANVNSSQPSNPPAQHSSFSAASYGAPAAGFAAGVGTQHQIYEQVHHGSNVIPSHPRPSDLKSSSMGMAHRRKRTGPLDKLVDFFKDPEGVGKFEEYTEAIGVCRTCFDPNSTPRDAPRKHHHRRRSGGRRGSSTRVDKTYRQSSSDEEKRRKSSSKKPWIIGGLAGYGLAKVGETLLNNKDFDDTYSVQSGRPDVYKESAVRKKRGSPPLGETLSSREAVREAVANLDEPAYQQADITIRRDKTTEEIYKERRSRRRQSSTSSSASCSSHHIPHPAASRVGIKQSERRLRKPSRSPSKRLHHRCSSPRRFSDNLSSTVSRDNGVISFISSPSANKRKGKRPKGLFGFQESSSSSDADLAFGEGSLRGRDSKRERHAKKNNKNMDNAILGLAVTGATLAAASSAKDRKKKPKSEGISTIERRHLGRGMSGTKGLRAEKASSSSEENSAWEDASEGEASDSSALAYGSRLSARRSRESLGSSDGTSKWAWRWNKSKPKQPGARSEKQPPSGSTSKESAGVGLETAVSLYPSPSASKQLSSSPTLRQLHPAPTSDPSVFDAIRQDLAATPNTNSAETAVTMSTAPLHHPQPLPRVSSALYDPSTSCSAPVYPIISPHQLFTRAQTDSVVANSVARADSVNRESQKSRSRRSSSPVSSTAPMDAGEKKLRRNTSTRQPPPSVTFDLTEEQITRERNGRSPKAQIENGVSSFLDERPEVLPVSDGASGFSAARSLDLGDECASTMSVSRSHLPSTCLPRTRSMSPVSKDNVDLRAESENGLHIRMGQQNLPRGPSLTRSLQPASVEEKAVSIPKVAPTRSRPSPPGEIVQPAIMQENPISRADGEEASPGQPLTTENEQPGVMEEEPASPVRVDRPPPRSSGFRASDLWTSPIPTTSPTAVPLHFRRLPMSPGSTRSASFSGRGAESLPSSPMTGRARQGRPNSTEIRCREFRPLWLVERHAAGRIEPLDTEQTYPSLPSSRTSSFHHSIEDVRGTLGLEDEYLPQQDPIHSYSHQRESTYSYYQDESTKSPELLDSGTATPTGAKASSDVKREKPKYEFHSPSELLQDPAAFPEQPTRSMSSAIPSLTSSQATAFGAFDSDEKSLQAPPDNSLLSLTGAESEKDLETRASVIENFSYKLPEAIADEDGSAQPMPRLPRMRSSSPPTKECRSAQDMMSVFTKPRSSSISPTATAIEQSSGFGDLAALPEDEASSLIVSTERHGTTSLADSGLAFLPALPSSGASSPTTTDHEEGRKNPTSNASESCVPPEAQVLARTVTLPAPERLSPLPRGHSVSSSEKEREDLALRSQKPDLPSATSSKSMNVEFWDTESLPPLPSSQASSPISREERKRSGPSPISENEVSHVEPLEAKAAEAVATKDLTALPDPSTMSPLDSTEKVEEESRRPCDSQISDTSLSCADPPDQPESRNLANMSSAEVSSPNSFRAGKLPVFAEVSLLPDSFHIDDLPSLPESRPASPEPSNTIDATVSLEPPASPKSSNTKSRSAIPSQAVWAPKSVDVEAPSAAIHKASSPREPAVTEERDYYPYFLDIEDLPALPESRPSSPTSPRFEDLPGSPENIRAEWNDDQSQIPAGHILDAQESVNPQPDQEIAQVAKCKPQPSLDLPRDGADEKSSNGICFRTAATQAVSGHGPPSDSVGPSPDVEQQEQQSQFRSKKGKRKLKKTKIPEIQAPVVPDDEQDEVVPSDNHPGLPAHPQINTQQEPTSFDAKPDPKEEQGEDKTPEFQPSRKKQKAKKKKMKQAEAALAAVGNDNDNEGGENPSVERSVPSTVAAIQPDVDQLPAQVEAAAIPEQMPGEEDQNVEPCQFPRENERSNKQDLEAILTASHPLDTKNQEESLEVQGPPTTSYPLDIGNQGKSLELHGTPSDTGVTTQVSSTQQSGPIDTIRNADNKVEDDGVAELHQVYGKKGKAKKKKKEKKNTEITSTAILEDDKTDKGPLSDVEVIPSAPPDGSQSESDLRQASIEGAPSTAPDTAQSESDPRQAPIDVVAEPENTRDEHETGELDLITGKKGKAKKKGKNNIDAALDAIPDADDKNEGPSLNVNTIPPTSPNAAQSDLDIRQAPREVVAEPQVNTKEEEEPGELYPILGKKGKTKKKKGKRNTNTALAMIPEYDDKDKGLSPDVKNTPSTPPIAAQSDLDPRQAPVEAAAEPEESLKDEDETGHFCQFPAKKGKGKKKKGKKDIDAAFIVDFEDQIKDVGTLPDTETVLSAAAPAAAAAASAPASDAATFQSDSDLRQAVVEDTASPHEKIKDEVDEPDRLSQVSGKKGKAKKKGKKSRGAWLSAFEEDGNVNEGDPSNADAVRSAAADTAAADTAAELDVEKKSALVDTTRGSMDHNKDKGEFSTNYQSTTPGIKPEAEAQDEVPDSSTLTSLTKPPDIESVEQTADRGAKPATPIQDAVSDGAFHMVPGKAAGIEHQKPASQGSEDPTEIERPASASKGLPIADHEKETVTRSAYPDDVIVMSNKSAETDHPPFIKLETEQSPRPRSGVPGESGQTDAENRDSAIQVMEDAPPPDEQSNPAFRDSGYMHSPVERSGQGTTDPTLAAVSTRPLRPITPTSSSEDVRIKPQIPSSKSLADETPANSLNIISNPAAETIDQQSGEKTYMENLGEGISREGTGSCDLESKGLGEARAVDSLGDLGDLGKFNLKSSTSKASKRRKNRQTEAEDLPSSSTYDPVNDKGKQVVRDMDDVYDGYGEAPRSPMSPTRPPSVRTRRSMQQIKDLEIRIDQLASENRLLAAAKISAEKDAEDVHLTHSRSEDAAQESLRAREVALQNKEAEIEKLRMDLDWMQGEVKKVTEVNNGLSSANETLATTHAQLELQHHETYSRWQNATRDLEALRAQHEKLSSGMEDIVRHEIETALASKNAELGQLYSGLEVAKDKIRELQQVTPSTRSGDILSPRDEDYFDNACQQLCQHVQQWVLRFSKFSDARVCKSTGEVRDEQIVERFDLAVVDGSEVDMYLEDRIKRRDVFMAVVMTMIWEYIFSRYLFGMDREQRQKLKQLEKNLLEVGPKSTVHRWRAITLTLLSRRDAFENQRVKDTEAVTQEIFGTLARFLPPPQNLEKQILDSLRNVMRLAVDLSIEMRTQCAEYIMLPPLKPEYTLEGDLKDKFIFNAALMNERSGETSSNEELQSEGAVVRMVLFPLVVKRGDDEGEGDEEVVVCPAQVLVAREGSRRSKKGKEAATRGMMNSDQMSIDQNSMRSTHSIAPSAMDTSNMI